MKKMTFMLVAVFVLAFASMSVAGDTAKSDTNVPIAFDAAQPVGAQATCPVMGDTFTITDKTPHSEADGKHVYFCCPGCKPQFDQNPEKFLPKK